MAQHSAKARSAGSWTRRAQTAPQRAQAASRAALHIFAASGRASGGQTRDGSVSPVKSAASPNQSVPKVKTADQASASASGSTRRFDLRFLTGLGPPIGFQGGRAPPLAGRLAIQVQFSDKSGEGEPRVALDIHRRMRLQ